MKAIGGQYEYSNSAKYQIGRPRSVCPAWRADAVRAGNEICPRRRVQTSRNAIHWVRKVSNRKRLLLN